MARASKMEMPAKGGKCGCNPLYMLVTWVLIALGLWALVEGFSAQFQAGAGWESVLVWYFAGALLIGLSKMTKWKSGENCGMHGCHC